MRVRVYKQGVIEANYLRHINTAVFGIGKGQIEQE